MGHLPYEPYIHSCKRSAPGYHYVVALLVDELQEPLRAILHQLAVLLSLATVDFHLLRLQEALPLIKDPATEPFRYSVTMELSEVPPAGLDHPEYTITPCFTARCSSLRMYGRHQLHGQPLT